MHADGGNQETCEGRADGAQTVESHRVERQRIEEVSWPGDVTHQGLARRVLKCLHSAGQEAGNVNMPWLDTIRKDERRQDEVEESVGDWATISCVLRPERSASAPATMPKRKSGMPRIAAARPTEAVSW